MKKIVFLLAVALLFQATFVRAQDEEPEDEGEEKEEEEFVRLRRSPGDQYEKGKKDGKGGDDYGIEAGRGDKEYEREKGKKFFLHSNERSQVEAALKKSKQTPKEKKLLLKKVEKKQCAEKLKLKTPKKKVDNEYYGKLKKYKSLYVKEKKGPKVYRKKYGYPNREKKVYKKNEYKRPQKKSKKNYKKDDGY